jgi:hypothetical protein
MVLLFEEFLMAQTEIREIAKENETIHFYEKES